ncbi:MAG TPA: ATPase, T2SS/T4P/T4SS family [Polyangia bacterium]
MIKLTITEKGGETKALSFDKSEVMIGRVQGNDIVLSKGNISKRHTKIESSAGQLTVSDMKSTNGTYVNGRKIAEPTAVRGGDKIFVGDFLIVLDPGGAASERTSSGAKRMPGPPPPPPPPPPPRGGRRPSAAHQAVTESAASEADLGLAGVAPAAPPSPGRAPAPPPPPPPRPTIATPSLADLEDDGMDLGLGEPPPSLADVGAVDEAAFGDSLGDMSTGGEPGANGAAASASAEPEPQPDVGSHDEADADVFGLTNAEDEDAGRASSTSGPPISLADPEEESARDDAPIATPAPASAPVPAAATSARRSERHAHDQRADGASSKHTATSTTITLETLLDDPTVTTIFVTAGSPVEVDKSGKREPIGEIGDRNLVAETIWQLANTAVPPPPGDNPVVDVRLPDGTHLTALFPPMTSAPVSAVIRKAQGPETTLSDLAGTSDVEKVLTAALAARRNILVGGDPQSATALMTALAAALPSSPEHRVVSLGVAAKARAGLLEIAPAGELGGLLRAAAAFRPHHLLVTNLGGAELPELLLCMARGQDGVIASLGARSAAEALGRLRAFSVNAIGAGALPSLVMSTIDLVVVVGPTSVGPRVIEIAEPKLEGDDLAPAFVARRPDSNRSSLNLDVPGVSQRLAAAIAVVADGVPPHLIRP